MGLTKEQSNELKDYFAVQQHEFLNGNTYITEEAITNRLDEVDPSWEFKKLEIHREGMVVTAVYRMIVCGVERDGVGMATVQLNKDKDREVNEAEKSAATDALKRCARLFGIGRYILEMGKAVTDHRSLQIWLANARRVDASTGEIPNISQLPPETRNNGHQSDLTGSDHTDIAKSSKTPQERLGTPSGQRIGGFNLGEFKTRALKEIYANNTIHMNKSLQILLNAGTLNYDAPGLTVDAALEIVRNRKEDVKEAG